MINENFYFQRWLHVMTVATLHLVWNLSNALFHIRSFTGYYGAAKRSMWKRAILQVAIRNFVWSQQKRQSKIQFVSLGILYTFMDKGSENVPCTSHIRIEYANCRIMKIYLISALTLNLVQKYIPRNVWSITGKLTMTFVIVFFSQCLYSLADGWFIFI